MNRTGLRSKEDFERNPRAYDDSLTLIRNQLGVIHAFLGAYCAGMRDRASAKAVRDALLSEPNSDCAANQTIAWMLGSLRVHDAMGLFYEGGIPLGRIADHVRANNIQRKDLIRWLNQFAVPAEIGDALGV